MKLVFDTCNCVVEGPDYSIYDGQKESCAADVKVNALDVAVKTQRRSAANRYWLSWTFQDSSKRRDPILSIPEAWVGLVVCEDQKSGCECIVYPLRKAK